jgi:cephalosporin hydroxylase
MNKYDQDVETNIEGIRQDRGFSALTQEWLIRALGHQYPKNFSWLGRPIIQVPTDIYAIQEIIWRVKPDLVIETGIAHGGSLILSASLLALLDYCDASAGSRSLSTRESKRRVVGIDIEIRPHNRKAIEAHPLAHLIEMIEGSSTDLGVVERVRAISLGFQRILVFLDSNHTHEHVLGELEAYAPLVAPGSYCVVWDTGVEDLPEGFVTDRPWGKGNNPKTAVLEFLKKLRENFVRASDGARLCFEMDKTIAHKITITASLDGFLRRV